MKTTVSICIIIIWTMVIFTILTGLSSAQVLNSDPEFLRAGVRPYQCTTPKGRKVDCNKWLFVAKRGWKKSCTGPGVSVLSPLADPFNAEIMLGQDSTKRQCVALFDEAWSDYRRTNIKNKRAQEQELIRELRPAEFHQFVEVKEAGTYEMNACMVREVIETPLNVEDGFDFSNHGGVTVSLIEWHPAAAGPTYHTILPERKAQFGPTGTLEGATNFDAIVDTFADRPETAPVDSVIGVREANEADVYNTAGIWAFNGFHRDHYYVDGFDGHAGLENAYQGGGYSLPDGQGQESFYAEWSCYSAQRQLNPGFYVLSAEIKPTFLARGGTEYFGFGAIKNIEFRRVE